MAEKEAQEEVEEEGEIGVAHVHFLVGSPSIRPLRVASSLSDLLWCGFLKGLSLASN